MHAQTVSVNKALCVSRNFNLLFTLSRTKIKEKNHCSVHFCSMLLILNEKIKTKHECDLFFQIRVHLH